MDRRPNGLALCGITEEPIRRFWARLTQPLGQYRWEEVGFALLLALAVALGIFGPARVLIRGPWNVTWTAPSAGPSLP